MGGWSAPVSLLAAVVRGVRSRSSLTAGSLLLTVVAVASAVLGPAYQAAVAQSFLIARLTEASPVSTGASITWFPSGTPFDDLEQALSEAATVGAKELGDQFEAATVMLESAGVPFRRVFGQELEGSVHLAAKDGACAHLVIAGSCPTQVGQAIVFEADAKFIGIKVGDHVAYPGIESGLNIVGTYAVPGDAANFFFDVSRLATAFPVASGLRPYQPAPLIVPSATFEQLPAQAWTLHVDRLLAAKPDISTSDVVSARRAVLALPKQLKNLSAGRYVVSRDNALQFVIAEINRNRETASNTVTPAVISLILVALALLVRLLAAAADQRRSELALGSLRGMTGTQMWTFGLAEPLTILLIAAPVGVALGYAATRGLSDLWLTPGIAVSLGTASLLAGLLVLSAAVVASVMTVGRALAEPLSAQLGAVRRPGRSTRFALTAKMVLVVAAAVIVVTSLTAERRSDPDSADLVLPLLLATATGLLASAATIALARRWSNHTGRRRGITGFVASRAVSRRQEGSLVILPLTAALAISVFAGGVYAAASTWRASTAATQVGADSAYMSPLTLAQTVAVTREIDPGGRWLMAAGVVYTESGDRLVLDTARLGRVGQWPATWTPGLDAADVARLLQPQNPPLSVSGRRFTIGVDNRVRGGAPPLGLSLQVETAAGLDERLFFGPYEPGRSTTTVTAPFCEQGCIIKSLLIGGPATTSIEMTGSVEVTELSANGNAVARAVDPRAWRPIVSVSAGEPQIASIGPPPALVVDLDSSGETTIGGITPADVPAVRPVVVGRSAGLEVAAANGRAQLLSSESLEDLPVDVVQVTESMPFLGPSGVLIDYTMMTRDQTVVGASTQTYVLARGDTPIEVVTALRERGISAKTDLEDTKAVLNQDAYALSLNLYLVAALAAVALALAGLAVHLAVQMPDRRRDAASLGVIGVRRRHIMRAVFAEICMVLGAAGLAGIAAGSVAQYLVVRSLTLGVATDLRTPRVLATLDTERLAIVVACVVALLVAIATAVAALSVHRARASTLRETVR